MSLEVINYSARPFTRNWLLCALMACLARVPAFADHSATLAWDPSPDTNAVGYKIYYGGSSGNYSNSINVGNATSATISGLTGGTTYYFSATAVSASGVESIFSNETSGLIPQTDTNTPPPVSQPPTLNAIANLTVYQNSGPQTVNLTGIGSGSANANPVLSITAVSSNALIPTPTINYTSPNSTGTLTFMPVTNALGTATLTVTVNNGATSNNLISRVFTVTVVPVPVVSQPPTLSAITNLTIYQNSGIQTVALSGIGAGSGGTVTVSAVSSNTAVIPTPTIYYTNSNSSGTLTLAPVTNALGTAVVTVTVNNGAASNNLVSQVFTVNVVPVPVPTLNTITNLTIYQNAGIQTIALTGIASGSTNANLTLTIWAYTSDPTVIPAPTVNYTSPNNTGTVTFAPVANALGTATLEVKVNNGVNNFSRVFTITVIPVPVVSQPPTLNAITNLTIYQNAGLQTVALTGIGAGSGGNGTITVTAVSSNTAIIPTPIIYYTNSNSSGTLTFAPAVNALGTATMAVTVNNGASSNNLISRVFTVTVVPVPVVSQPPTLNAITNLTIYQNAGLQTVALTGISAGAGGNGTVTFTAVSSNIAVIPTPVVYYTNSNISGSLTFVPAANALGTATIAVMANNGASSNNLISRVFTVTVVPVPVVSQPPTLNAITNLTIYQNAGLQTVALTGISAGSGGNATVTITAVSSNTAIIPTPTIYYTNSNSSGSLTFAPFANALGTATLAVTVNNGASSNNLISRMFTVTVIPVPVVSQPPTLNAITNLTIYQNTGLQTVALTGISAGSGGNATVTITAVSSNTAIIPTPTIYYTNSNSSGSLTFAPFANALGTATIAVTVNNGASSNNLISRVFTVTVVPVPVVSQPPTLNAITNLAIYQNAGPQTIALTGISAGSGGNPTVNISAISSDATIIPTPMVNYTNGNSTGTLTFAPVINSSGTATVTVTVNNGATSNNLVSRAFTITVQNPIPAMNAVTNLTIFQNAGSQTVSLTGITSGSTNANLTLTIWAYTSDPTIIPAPTVNYISPNNTGSLTFAPIPNQLGTATVEVKINNGINNFSRVFSVTVVPAPVLIPPTLDAITNLTIYESSAAKTIVLTSITPGSTNLNRTMTVSAVSSNPALIPTPAINYTSPNNFGLLTFKPLTNVLGSATLAVTVDDGAQSNNIVTRTFTVTVVVPPGGNHPPTLNPLTDITIMQGTASQSVTLAGIGTGLTTEKQTLKVSATSSNPSHVPVPTIVYTSPGTTGTLTLKPSLTNLGTATITVAVNDGGKSNNIVYQSFTVTVVSNTPPTLNPTANLLVAKNAGTQTITLGGISSGSPKENQVLKITVASSNPHVIPAPTVQYTSPANSALLTFKPLANATGISTVTVTVNDGSKYNNLVHQVFTVTVMPPPTNGVSAPGANPITAATLATAEKAGNQFSFQVTGVLGGKYVVETTSDLIHWTPVQTNLAPFVFQDNAVHSSSQQFYRATYSQ